MPVMSRFVPRDRAATEHYARVARVVFDKPDGSFLIAETPDGGTVMGTARAEDFESGVTYKFLGRWEDDPARGYRFRFSTFSVHALHSRAAVVKYLCDLCDGIGPKAAEKLWTAYGGLAVEQLRERPHETAEATGLNLDLCQEAAESLTRDMRYQDTKIQLHGLFQGRGFQGKLIGECLDRWGPKAADVIRANPFRLLDMTSAGFKRCDKLYLDCGLNPAALKRQAICSANLVRTARDGHTWFDAHEIASRLKDLIPGANPVKAFKLGLRAGLLDKHRDEAGKLWITTAVRAYCERMIVDHIRRLSAGPACWPTDRVPVSQEDGDRLPSEHQVERLESACAGRVGLFIGGPGTGKAMPVATPVLTPNGYRPIGELRVGDSVVGSDGKPTAVKGVYPQGVVETYRVTFSDGASVECCGEHLWHTATRRERKNARRSGAGVESAGRTRTTKEIAATLESEDGHRNHFIPMVKPVEFEATGPPPIDPYLLGVLLGDGHLGERCIQLSNPEPEVADEVAAAMPGDMQLVRHKHGGCASYQLSKGMAGVAVTDRNPLLKELRSLNLAGLNSPEKFIPDCYLYGTVSTRIAVLQGLLDTDGYTDGHAIEYSTSSPALADGMVHLVESLGGTCTVSWRDPTFTHKGEKRIGKPSARIVVKLPGSIQPFRLPRKANRYKAKTKYQPIRQVVSVERVTDKDSVCIAVAAADQLYVTQRFIVTHNTYSLAYLLKEVIRDHGAEAVAVCAPTGKAALRAGQSLRAAGVDVSACTIHSLLIACGALSLDGADGDDMDGFGDLTGKLDCKYLVVDESSMIDTNLMAVLLAAVPTGCHVLFVGDPYQLPPVGHGSPLRDLIAAGLPCGELTQVRRNAGQIVHACLRIKNQEDFETTDRIDLDAEPPRNLRLIHAKDEKAQGDMLALILGGMKGFHPVWGCQVIVARNKGGEVTRRPLNERLQGVLNPDGYAVDGNPFRVGDKVICLKNSKQQVVDFDPANDETDERIVRDAAHYYTRYTHDRDTGHREPVQVKVMNGEIGRVVAVGGKQMVVRFSERDELIRVPMGKSDKAEDGGDGGEDDNGRGCNFDLGYAVTCHKLQGSSAPCIIIMADANGGGICTREWWYTAVSRPEKVCLIVGSRSVVDKQRVRVSTTRRKTFLVEQLTKPLPETTNGEDQSAAG